MISLVTKRGEVAWVAIPVARATSPATMSWKWPEVSEWSCRPPVWCGWGTCRRRGCSVGTLRTQPYQNLKCKQFISILKSLASSVLMNFTLYYFLNRPCNTLQSDSPMNAKLSRLRLFSMFSSQFTEWSYRSYQYWWSRLENKNKGWQYFCPSICTVCFHTSTMGEIRVQTG